jgi:multimeric flavodoxin WrbA
MKVLVINGSPHKKNTTWRALDEVQRTLQAEGIETERYQVPADTAGCMGCGFCEKNGSCVRKDQVCEIAARLDEFDGFIVGTPTYYASPSGSLIAFLDRLFYSAGSKMAKKPAAAVAIARRGGTETSFDVINKYFAINQMPIITSTYWNNVFGFSPADAEKDLEGLQTMRNLARNMAWILKAIDAGKKAGIQPPETEKAHFTSFCD